MLLLTKNFNKGQVPCEGMVQFGWSMNSACSIIFSIRLQNFELFEADLLKLSRLEKKNSTNIFRHLSKIAKYPA